MAWDVFVSNYQRWVLDKPDLTLDQDAGSPLRLVQEELLKLRHFPGP